MTIVPKPLWAETITKNPDAEIALGIATVNILKLGKAAQIAYDEHDIKRTLERSDAIFEIVRDLADKNGQDRADIFRINALKLHEAGYIYPAERLFYKAYRINARVFGEYHPYTLSSLTNLASNLNAQGRFAEAAVHYEQVLRFRTLALGSRAPLTINSLANLGYTYGQQGQTAKARTLLERALKLSVATRGRDHAESAKVMVLLADLLGNEQFASESETYLRDALKILTAANGPYHVDTMSCLHRLGTNLSMQEKYSEAEPYFYHAWTRRESKLGKDNDATLQSKEALIGNLTSQGLEHEVSKILGTAEETIE